MTTLKQQLKATALIVGVALGVTVAGAVYIMIFADPLSEPATVRR